MSSTTDDMFIYDSETEDHQHLCFHPNDFKYVYEVGNTTIKAKIDTITIDEPGIYHLDSDIYGNLEVVIHSDQPLSILGNNHTVHGWLRVINKYHNGPITSVIVIKDVVIKPPHPLTNISNGKYSCLYVENRKFDNLYITNCNIDSPVQLNGGDEINQRDLTGSCSESESESESDSYENNEPTKRTRWWFW